MTEEIKKLLDELKNDDYISPYQDVYSVYPIKTIDKKQTKLLLNYITNLQKENKNLKLQIKGYEQERENILNDIVSRNEKAVEYIENHSRFEPPYYEMREFNNKANLNELYNILQGGDE